LKMKVQIFHHVCEMTFSIIICAFEVPVMPTRHTKQAPYPPTTLELPPEPSYVSKF
jgi:hypothetical protein